MTRERDNACVLQVTMETNVKICVKMVDTGLTALKFATALKIVIVIT